eukprot:TRINITY_DN158_c0_g1_i1.p1 TRINITY_DN158_c0_g1~~TRINITY_DN158_c0_g1_i1.p1  ORF type:complete len:225 (+),score=36.20 TRINITY_DN158_c0_g1_i1:217-891(+)
MGPHSRLAISLRSKVDETNEVFNCRREYWLDILSVVAFPTTFLIGYGGGILMDSKTFENHHLTKWISRYKAVDLNEEEEASFDSKQKLRQLAISFIPVFGLWYFTRKNNSPSESKFGALSAIAAFQGFYSLMRLKKKMNSIDDSQFELSTDRRQQIATVLAFLPIRIKERTLYTGFTSLPAVLRTLLIVKHSYFLSRRGTNGILFDIGTLSLGLGAWGSIRFAK